MAGIHSNEQAIMFYVGPLFSNWKSCKWVGSFKMVQLWTRVIWKRGRK